VNYREALAWLDGAQVFGIKLGLENTRRLLAAAGDPQDRLRFLHVAGTNGKGSTCAMLDAVLREAGLRSALYTSPHLTDFRERIVLGGEMIDEASVAEGLTLLRGAAADWDHAPTYFELATVLAAWWFEAKGAEVVVWETGMGGRLDATNAVTPLVSVITPIGFDHQKWLGDTLGAIAGEKAGIIKPGVPVVSAPQAVEALHVIEARAAAAGAPLTLVGRAHDSGKVGLEGPHQRWNAAVALAALDAAGLVPDDPVRARGLAAVVWPARFQRLGDRLIIDGAHNPAAVEVLVATWREAFGGRRGTLIFGALADKDVPVLLRLLREICEDVWVVPVASERGCDVDVLASAARAAGFAGVRTSGVREALAAATAGAVPVLVTGSLFLAGEVLRIRGRMES
jgi:dihydrofolate synthase/folylpolyglutamate synthase